MTSPQETMRNDPAALFARALEQHAAGRLDEAEKTYREVLGIDPRHAECLHNLGVLAHQTGRHELAKEKIAEAILLDGAVPAFHFNLGMILASHGEAAEAIASYERALAIKPDYVEALFSLGTAYHSQGRLDLAISCYRDVLATDPNRADAQSNLGVAYQSQGRLDEAIRQFRAVLAINPDHADALSNLGAAFQAQHRYGDAIAAYEKSLAARPLDAEVLSNLATALRAAGKREEAIRRFEQALAVAPRHPGVLANFANTLREASRLDEAIARCEQALAIHPDHPEALTNLANALQRQGKPGIAVERYDQALALRPDYPEALANRGMALQELGRVDAAIESYERAIRIKPDYAAAYSNLLMAMHYSDSYSNEVIRERTAGFSTRFEMQFPAEPYTNSPQPARRLRVGYVSGDFRSHPVGTFIGAVLPAHDRAGIEIFCYSNDSDEDAVTAHLRRSADHWRTIVGVSDEDAARLIRADQIDILVDLAGHTAANRLLLFARKPAPLQITWLGYPGSTGLKAIGYRLVDAVTDPTERADALATETLVRLPHGFLCYDPPKRAPDPDMLPSLAAGTPVTFGSFNNLSKLSDVTLDAWGALLRQLPAARLLLKGRPFAEASTRDLFLSRLGARGVSSERVEMVGWLPDAVDHLALYHRIDIALDPYPYNGTTTTCEALWMGAPVVTLRGHRHSGRVGASLLERVGLTELIATTPEQYVAIAVDLAAAPARLAELRHTLRRRMLASSLCDPPGFTRSLEVAYRAMWQNWCDGRTVI